MKPMTGLVALLGSLAGCAPDSACEPGAMCGRVVEGQDARLSKEAVSLEVALLWEVYDPSVPYFPMTTAVSGELPLDFAVAIGDAPPAEAMFQIEDPELGVVTDPEAPWVAATDVYVIAPGAVEKNLDGVMALDPGVVLGMSDDVVLFYTPVDLDTTAGIRGISNRIDDQAIEAGYHLYEDGAEVDLATPIEAKLEYLHD